jgi:3',5'-cyclic-AMP phosphodiesterase
MDVFLWQNNMMNDMKRFTWVLLIFAFFTGCDTFEYSPNQVFDNNSLKDLNARNIEELMNSTPNDDTIKFVLTGDPQRAHDHIEELVKKANSLNDLDFVIIAGDLSEFGTLQEMNWVAESFSELNVPFIAVIGNHDMVARGRTVLQRMFGDFNFSFTYGGVKFICHDTNSREYQYNGNVPDLPWLAAELQPQEGVSGSIAISHVPPNSHDFDQNLVEPYTSLFSQTPGFLGSFHAHNHVFSEFKYEGSPVPYIVTSAVAKQEFLLVKIVNNRMSYERVYF